MAWRLGYRLAYHALIYMRSLPGSTLIQKLTHRNETERASKRERASATRGRKKKRQKERKRKKKKEREREGERERGRDREIDRGKYRGRD